MLIRRILVAVAVVVGVVSVAAPAGAHAVLIGTSPAADAVLDAPPTEIVLDFNEPVTVTADAVRLIDPAGDEVTGIEAALEGGDTIVAALPEIDLDGSYTVGWRAVSGDGHPIRGAYLFHLGDRTLTEPAEIPDAGAPVVSDLLRAAGAVAAIAGLVGVFVARTRTWRWLPVVGGTVLATAGALVAVGGSPGPALEVVLDTTSGRMSVLAVLVALCGAIAARWAAPSVELAVAGAAVVAVAAQGHAVSLEPVALSATLTVAHVAAAVLWGTGLVLLERRTRSHEGTDLVGIVRRGSPIGVAAVLVLAGSGAVLVLERVPLDELTSTTYGRLSLLKVALLVVAVAVALVNRTVLVRRLGGSDDSPTTALRRSVRIEALVLAGALVAGAALAQVPPDGGGPAGGDVVERVDVAGGFVEITVEPGRRGTNEVHVLAIDTEGRLMGDLEDLSLALSLPERDLGPLEPEMQPIAAGHSVAYAEVPLAGDWEFVVTARAGPFEELEAQFTVPVGNR